jgi:hypothetical protein
MFTNPITLIIGVSLSTVSLFSRPFIMNYLLHRNYSRRKIFLIGFIPGIFFTIGMNFTLSTISSDPEVKIPLYYYFYCSIFWLLIWALFEFYIIIMNNYRPKIQQSKEAIKHYLKK